MIKGGSVWDSIMTNQNFIDHIKIYCKSGNGGKGSSHFRREKFVPKGGPDGGDGGKGGNIIIKGNSQLWTLFHLRYTKHIKAENGGDGTGSKKHGNNGKDIIGSTALEKNFKIVKRNSYLEEILLSMKFFLHWIKSSFIFLISISLNFSI